MEPDKQSARRMALHSKLGGALPSLPVRRCGVNAPRPRDRLKVREARKATSPRLALPLQTVTFCGDRDIFALWRAGLFRLEFGKYEIRLGGPLAYR
jgi:hypothetical protein